LQDASISIVSGPDRRRNVSATRDNPAEALSGREIVNTRIFDAPREVVFKAFSNADHLAQWWGPRGFTNVFQQFEFRPGGLWRFVMRSPKGADYPNESVFVEIIEPERIVLRHLRPIHEFQMTITFEELNGKTGLTWRMLFRSAAECDKIRSSAAAANEQNFDRLQAHLAKMG
jgi:uncharacterized protein YndB with AHSA1/START domain